MNVKVKFFAVSREITGMAQLTQALPEGATLLELQAQIFETYPKLQAQRVRFAINLTYAPLTAILHDGDEVACIPPVGGG